jgi:hypothetical protein
MRTLSITSQPAVIEPTATTQDGKPVVAVDGALYVVEELNP